VIVTEREFHNEQSAGATGETGSRAEARVGRQLGGHDWRAEELRKVSPVLAKLSGGPGGTETPRLAAADYALLATSVRREISVSEVPRLEVAKDKLSASDNRVLRWLKRFL